MSAQILISRADGVCEVRFNRPEKRNAITFAMYEALYRGLREAQADAAVRVVLLGGEGAGFCAGNDLNDFLTGPPFSAEHRAAVDAVRGPGPGAGSGQLAAAAAAGGSAARGRAAAAR